MHASCDSTQLAHFASLPPPPLLWYISRVIDFCVLNPIPRQPRPIYYTMYSPLARNNNAKVHTFPQLFLFFFAKSIICVCEWEKLEFPRASYIYIPPQHKL